MVQLQAAQKEFAKAGLQVAAISYDSVAALRRFARRRKITFPLLSDADSRVIDAFGVRNREARGSRIDGVPYPGTFLIDPKGFIRAKLFYDGYRKRHSTRQILEALAALKPSAP